MTNPDLASSPGRAPSGRYLPALFLLFVGSGCAAMIYEIVWLQLLQLLIGSTAASLGVLLGTFMGGMCLGSLLLPRLVPARRHPLRVYALLELGIGVIGLALLYGMPHLEAAYSLHAVAGPLGILLRAAVAGACLVPPTLLMGATLPAIARWVAPGPEGVPWLGFFYGGNIAGAVLGCLLAGFYLLRVHDMATATWAAFAINAAVAAIALGLAARSPRPVMTDQVEAFRPIQDLSTGAWTIYLAIALSGTAALGAEVIWTRLLSLMLGGTVYTFSLILAVFLVGLGIGSGLGSLIADRVGSARVALGACQWLLVGAVAWTATMISGSLPFWPIQPSLSSSPWFTLQLDLARCLWAVLPPACFWGASFPLALAAIAARGQDPGRLVGGVYAANTLGAIVGALGFSLVLVPAIGTAGAERALIGLAAAAGLLALMPVVRRSTGAARLGGMASLAVAAVVAGWLARGVEPMPWMSVAFGRQAPQMLAHSAPGIAEDRPPIASDADFRCVYVGEGANVSVAVTLAKQGFRSFHGAGKVQASTSPTDMRLQRMLGHIPALVHPKPESVLVVACGAGITAGTFLLHPEVKRVVICDIEPLVPTVVAPMFGAENHHVVDGIARQNPHVVAGKQVEVIYDDGRHFLRTTEEKFDIITSDPIDPWVKGCAALNTVEYYRMCLDHLNPGGSVSLWLPLAESDLEATRSLIATFFEVFPQGILWSNERDGYGYDAVLFGQAGPTVIDVDLLQKRLVRPDHRPVKQSLQDVGLWEPRGFDGQEEPNEGIDLMATYAGQASLLKGWTAGAQLNTDRNLRLQFLAGLSLNSATGHETLTSILEHYRFPVRTFVGPTAAVRALDEALKRRGRFGPKDGSTTSPDQTNPSPSATPRP